MNVPYFGPSKNTPRSAPRASFTLGVERDESVEEHQFTALLRVDMLSVNRMIQATRGDGAESIPAMIRMMGRMLDNTDGVPNSWKLEQLPSWPDTDTERSAFLAAIAEEDGGEYPGKPDDAPRFRAPDGQILPMSEAERFTRHAAGSSRRRWRELMEEDDDAYVSVEDLEAVMKWLVAAAGKGHTRVSS